MSSCEDGTMQELFVPSQFTVPSSVFVQMSDQTTSVRQNMNVVHSSYSLFLDLGCFPRASTTLQMRWKYGNINIETMLRGGLSVSGKNILTWPTSEMLGHHTAMNIDLERGVLADVCLWTCNELSTPPCLAFNRGVGWA